MPAAACAEVRKGDAAGRSGLETDRGAAENPAQMNLRTTALRGGLYLVLRQGFGVAVSAVGLVLLTRILGPESYGVWAAVVGIYAYLASLSGWGANVYLIRRREEPVLEDYHQAFTLLLLLGTAGAGIALLTVPLLDRWLQIEGFVPVAVALFAGLPLNLIAAVPLARLERALDYRKVAITEMSALLIFYPVALPLAYYGFGPWAPVAGWWATQLLTLAVLYRVCDYRPRLHWEKSRARAMVRYGLGYSFSDWIWNLGNLVNPLIVGRYAGAEAVGQVALAIRLVEQLSFVILMPVARLSIPVFARLREDRTRVANALAEGTYLQLLVVGPLLALFGLAAPWLIPGLLGPEWAPVIQVYPLIALAYLTGAALSLHSSILFVLGRLLEMAIFRALHVILFAGAALVLVPRLGLVGYGWASIVALSSYALLLFWIWRSVGRPASPQTLAWFAGWAAPLFVWQLGPLVWTGAVALLVWPSSRRELLGSLSMVVKKLSGN